MTKNHTPIRGPVRLFANLRLLLLLIAGITSSYTLPAFQGSNRNVSGVVTDAETGDALPGTTVQVEGTSTGTITDVQGAWSLQVPTDKNVLIFSFVGYTTLKVNIDQRSQINVQLTIEADILSELVVVGYGVQKKVNLSGAVESIDAEALIQRPISNVAQGLQGMVSNLNVDFLSGEPGEAANINIRGITSINGGGNPLILIDGVPSDSRELNRLSAQDIESLSVIKDASASAIYGARAAFGVILINTKSGSSEGIKINYSSNVSWDKPTVLPEKVSDPYIYLRTKETSTDNTPWDNWNWTDQRYEYAKNRSDNPDGTPGVRENPTSLGTWEYMGNRDWTRYFMDDYTISTNHQLGISGGSEKTQYYFSGAYNRQNGALKIADDFFDRYNVRSKVTFKPFDWLEIGNNSYMVTTNRDRPTYLSISDIYNTETTDWDINPDGTWANTAVGREAAQLTDGGKENTVYNSLQSRFTAKMTFFDDLLTLNSDFTYRKGSTNYDWYQTRYAIGYGPGDVREIGDNYAWREATFENYYAFNTYATVTKAFGLHSLTGIIGYNQEYSGYENFRASKTKLISPSLPTIALSTGSAEDSGVGESLSEWAIRGTFFRLNYNFSDRYILEFNGRYDGTSKFPADKRFGFFPSASAAWRISEESFMDGLSSTISNLKMRVSYGTLGNQLVSDPYGYIASMSSGQSGYLIGGTVNTVIFPPGEVSGNYSWEEATTLNLGFDFGFWEDRLTANFDIYKRDTKNMLTQGRELPAVLGASEPLENAADLETKGWEIGMAYQNSVEVAGSPFRFNVQFNLSDNRSFITEFDNPNNNLTQFYNGMEFGEIWGLQSDGLFANQGEIDALDESSIIPWGALSIVPGWPKYVDTNGDNVIDKGGYTLTDHGDLSVIGNFHPRLRHGIDLSANWKGFDFRVFFQGVGKRDLYPLDYLYWGWYQQPYAGGYAHLHDYYRAQDDSDILRAKHSQAYLDAGLADQNLDARYPVLQAWLADRNLGERPDQAKGLAIPQTGYMLDGSYLRLKNLTFGYSLPNAMLSKVGLNDVRIYFSGENLFEWSELKQFYDPESVNSNLRYNPAIGSISRTDGKGYSYPMQRRYAFGLNIGF